LKAFSFSLAAGLIAIFKITGGQGNYRICPADRYFQIYTNEYTLDLYPGTLKTGMRSIIVRSVGHSIEKYHVIDPAMKMTLCLLTPGNLGESSWVIIRREYANGIGSKNSTKNSFILG